MFFSYEPTSTNLVLDSKIQLDVVEFYDRSFFWTIEKEIEKELVSSWDIGEGEYYWYRVESECKEVNCENLNLNYDCPSMTLLTTVAARNAQEVCEILSSPNKLNPPVYARILSIKKYSRPILKSNIVDDQCNFLEEESFCQIPECFDYCLDQNVIDFFRVDMKSIEVFFLKEMTGGIRIKGNAENNRYKNHTCDSCMLTINGQSEISFVFNFKSNCEFDISNRLIYTSTHYSYSPSGGLKLAGISRVVSPRRQYSGSLRLSILGAANFSFNFGFSGKINFSGSSYYSVLQKMGAGGSINVAGELKEHTSPSYYHRSNGEISLQGKSQRNFEILGTFTEQISFSSKVFGIESDYEGQKILGNDLTISQPTISPSCGCGPISLSLLISCNINKSLYFSNFLTRNGISYPSQNYLRYRTADNSWSSSQHFKGISQDGLSFEEWIVMFSLSCKTDFWKFVFFVKKTNLNYNKNLDSKLIVEIPADLICGDNNISTNLKLSLGMPEATTNTNQQILVVPRESRSNLDYFSKKTQVFIDGVLKDYLIYYDNIGLFKDSYWKSNLFDVQINPRARKKMPKANLKNIFPL